MSFSSQTKKELTSLETPSCCQRAELSALIRMNGSVAFSNRNLAVDVQTENAAIARRIYSLLKEQFDVPVELLVRKKMKLKKNNVYIVRFIEMAHDILNQLRILESEFSLIYAIDPVLIKNDCCKRAYLRGAFLSGGSVNNPETSAYHLEIFSLYEEHNASLHQLLESFKLNSKTLERKKGFICYIKEAEKISEFLTIIEAYHALLHFEDTRIIRDLRNSANRLTNCDNANINKIVSAAGRQVDNIKWIEHTIGIDALPIRLQEVARLRLAYPEAPLKELCELIRTEKISKSGLNHRFGKLDVIAEKLRKGTHTSQS